MKTGFLIFFIVLSFSFCVAYLAMLERIKILNIELFTIKTAQLRMPTNVFNKESVEDIHKENFIKFLSDSREWAYHYIENSQKEIKEIVNQLNEDGLYEYADRLSLLLPEK